MSARPGNRRRQSDWPLVLISLGVLLACLFYTLALAFLVPYPGVLTNTGWVVIDIDPCDDHPGWCEANPNRLQVGDRLIAIGDLTYEDYWNDRRRVPFDGYGPGESVSITLRRDGREQTIHWQMPRAIGANRVARLRGTLFYLPFWLVGTVVLLFLRPRDRRWRLLVSFNYLTAIWLAAGMASYMGVAASSLVLHAVTWLFVPVYLHLHLLVPTPLLRQRSRYFLSPLYAIAAVLAALELFQLLPESAYALGLLLAIPGSLGLLVFRLFDRSFPSARLAARLMLAGIGLAFGPGLVLGLIPKLLGLSAPGFLAIAVALLAVPVLPLSYTYVIYKRRLGPLEFRANRLLSLYSFTLLYGTVFVLIFLIGSRWLGVPGDSVVFGLVVSLVFVIAAPTLHARFQRLVGRLAYGTEHSPDDIVRAFANQIPAALDRKALVQLLVNEVTPSLLVRQSALYLLADGNTSIVYARGTKLGETAEASRQIRQLLAGAGRYRPPLAEAQDEFDWVRLAIPLEIQERTVGIWLFGRRDPDDYYPQSDITLLTTLASQVSVAVENSRLYEQAQREITERKRAEEQVQASLREKVVLLQEIHHRVRNNLQVISSLLDLQSRAVQDEQGREAFRDSQNRIQSMAHIHEQLYLSKDLARIDMAEYIQDLTAHLRRSYGAYAIAIKIDAADVMLGVDTAIPCGLIINELVSNSLKHAFPPDGGASAGQAVEPVGEICIAMRADDDRFELVLSDNGVGLPADLDLQNPKSLGLRLVRLLTHQLGGITELNVSHGPAFKITF